MITWLPIAPGIVLGTAVRLVVFVVGGGKGPAAVGSVLCAGLGAMASAFWLDRSLKRSREGPGWLEALKLSATWVLLSVAFRAFWVGMVIGGGWTGVTIDYQVWDGQPWAISLALIAAAPLVLQWRSRTLESPR